MIRVGDLVQGFYFHRKIGIVIRMDGKAEMALVRFTDNTQCWEPVTNIQSLSK